MRGNYIMNWCFKIVIIPDQQAHCILTAITLEVILLRANMPDFTAFESTESINLSLPLLRLIGPWDEETSFSQRICSLRVTFTLQHTGVTGSFNSPGFLMSFSCGLDRRWNAVSLKIINFITSPLNNIPFNFLYFWIHYNQMATSCSGALSGQQGGVKLWFLSVLKLLRSSPTSPDSLSPAPWRERPTELWRIFMSEGEQLVWDHLTREGEKRSGGGRRGGGREKGENVRCRWR